MAPEKTDPIDCSNSSSGATTTVSTSAADTSTVSIDSTNGDNDPYFEPVISLPEVTIETLEEDEEEIYKGRCKVFRYAQDEEEGGMWKERGTGNIKLLKHQEKGLVRVLMRQEKTLKVRVNHYITPYMKLRANCGSDRAFVWYVMFDFADEEPKSEMFAIRFANADNARVFKEAFEGAVAYVTSTLVQDCCFQFVDADDCDEEEEETAQQQEAVQDEESPAEKEDSTSQQEADSPPATTQDITQQDTQTAADVAESLQKLQVADPPTVEAS